MSRIGKMPIKIVDGVTVNVENNNVTVKGPKGTLAYKVEEVIGVEVKDGFVNVTRTNEEKHTKQLHGTTRANIQNMITGVSKGYKKDLVMTGTGYKAEVKGNKLVLGVAFSHPVIFEIPSDIKVTITGQTTNSTSFTVEGFDKQKVGQFAAVVRSVREPEPYKGKGIAYANEHIRRKEGKKAGKK